jgi:hypothetical protein
VFASDPVARDEMDTAGIPVVGTLGDLPGRVDVVADCAPKKLAAANRSVQIWSVLRSRLESGKLRLVVAVPYLAMRWMIAELLDRHSPRRTIRAPDDADERARVGVAEQPNLVVGASCTRCFELRGRFLCHRVVVFRPELGSADRDAARGAGAEAWLAWDDVAGALESRLNDTRQCRSAGELRS